LIVSSKLPLAIFFPSGLHAIDKTLKLREVNTRINRKKQEKTREKYVPARVPGQGRLAISRLQVPNLDGFVIATAGNLFSIGASRHRPDPELARSQHTNQQNKQKKLDKNLQVRVPGQRRLALKSASRAH